MSDESLQIPPSASWLVTNLRPITVLGVPALVMAFLVYWLTMVLSNQLSHIDQTLRDHDRQLAVAVSRLDAFLYSLCLSVSTTEIDRSRCAIARSDGTTKSESVR